LIFLLLGVCVLLGLGGGSTGGGTALLLLLLLLNEGELDATTTGEGNERLLAGADSEDVVRASGEGLASKILDVDDAVAARVVLDLLEETDTTQVAAGGDHDEVTNTKLDVVLDLARGEVDLDGVVDLDVGVGVADGAAIVGRAEGDTLGAELDAADLAELVASLLGFNAVESEAALDVVEKTEVLVGALNGDDIHEAGGEGGVSADLAIDLDDALVEDEGDLTTSKGIAEAVAEEDDQRQALAELVGTSRGAGSLKGITISTHPKIGPELIHKI